MRPEVADVKYIGKTVFQHQSVRGICMPSLNFGWGEGLNTPAPLLRRLQNSPYFCVFKYARAVKQKVWNEAENRERDWGETLRAGKTLTPRFTDFFTDFEKKTDCFAVYAMVSC